MLSLLAEVYSTFPERGDLDRPELVIFIDEAHLVFNEASKTLLEQIETIIKLIRSKGVGIFFCTQNPTDIPSDVLAQLGLKVQHALRAFTAKDRQAIKLVAQNYPITEYYKVEDDITQLGIGEVFVTALNEKGIPTPLVHTLMSPPQSRMDVLSPEETKAHIEQSALYKKYKDAVDSESAYELLNNRINAIAVEKESQEAPAPKQQKVSVPKSSPSTFEKVLNNKTTKSLATTATREITRGLLGILVKAFKK
jgi:hypothetical protein